MSVVSIALVWLGILEDNNIAWLACIICYLQGVEGGFGFGCHVPWFHDKPAKCRCSLNIERYFTSSSTV